MAFCKAPRFAPPVCTGPGPGTYNVTSKVAGPRYSFGPGQPRLGRAKPLTRVEAQSVRLTAQLGKGGFAIVLQAQHKGQQLAAKMLCPQEHALPGQEAKDVDELQSEVITKHSLLPE